MSVILPQNSNIKPIMWMCDPGTVAYNCAQMGLPVPVLAMPFWEKAGSKAYDYSGQRQHGTLVGSTRNIEGILFDADSERIEIGDYDFYSGNKISVEAKFRVGGLLAERRIINKPGAIRFDIEDVGAGVPRFRIYISSVSKTVQDTTQVTLGEVIHLMGVYDGSSVILYRDGKNVAETAATGNIDLNNNALWIGCDSGDPTGREFRGTIFFVNLYKDALTPTQVQTRNNDPYGMFEQIRSPAIWSPPVGGIAPTSIFYGPLGGSLSGPI